MIYIITCCGLSAILSYFLLTNRLMLIRVLGFPALVLTGYITFAFGGLLLEVIFLALILVLSSKKNMKRSLKSLTPITRESQNVPGLVSENVSLRNRWK